jgi:P27 family predicted phage terminase small subunit
LKVTKEGWSAFWASGLAATVTEKDLAALRRLFDQRNMHERFARIVNRSPLIDGSKGQPVLNPLAALMTKLASEVRQMEREFGLTPDAGARMLASTASASRSVEELVRGDDGLQVIDVSD